MPCELGFELDNMDFLNQEETLCITPICFNSIQSVKLVGNENFVFFQHLLHLYNKYMLGMGNTKADHPSAQ